MTAFDRTLLSRPVQFLKGVGPRKAEALKKLGVTTVGDLLLYVPRRYLDRTSMVTIAQLHSRLELPPSSGELEIRREVTVVGEVRSFRVMGIGRKARLVLVLADDTGSMQCLWFGGVQYWKTRFHVGDTLAVSGQPTAYGSIVQIVHPDVDWLASEGEALSRDTLRTLHTGGLIPLYPSSQELSRLGLDSGGFRRLLGSVLREHADRIMDPLPADIRAAYNFIPLAAAMRAAHFPAAGPDIAEGLRRLKYGELFEFQVKLGLRRQVQQRESRGISFNVQSRLARQLVDGLPYALTRAQTRVVKEILNDMNAGKPMNRLLQGDVGSGKTVVAVIAMLVAVENGYQAAFLAPTEILAEQHFRTIAALLGPVPVSHRLLVGAQKSRLRRDVLEDIRRGTAQLVVGTHALLEEEVVFSHLGLLVIDEQHRFGVMQRAQLRAKGESPDVLVMTATPIPRTLSLTLYGDLDVSVIDELPGGRRPITTVIRYEDQKESVYAFVRAQVVAGRQVYFVYPLIEESEKLTLKAATVHFEQLQQMVFPALRLGLLHGRMTGEEKEEVMRRFKERELDILVATTVIEVGIDIPNATVMVIENAERFGLSQLHQLRGRVGRGSEQSYCLLLTERWVMPRRREAPTSQTALDQQRTAERRLSTMVRTTDGFVIAEVDLELRGPGDFFGTRQSGVPEFRVANIVTDGALLASARQDAFALVANDPQLRREEHRALADHLRSRFAEEMTLLHTG
jgi:ATP-dependent DNA helicase RecG